MGFTNVILMGDSGGNQTGMKEVAAALNAKYNGTPARFYFIPEYYDYSSVQKFIQDSGIPEQIKIGASNGSDGIHEEYGIDALMALARSEDDPHRAAQEGQPRDDQRRRACCRWRRRSRWARRSSS